jgi:hypothetical protein
MNFFFWLFQIVNMGLAIFLFIAIGFKQSFSPSGTNLGFIGLIVLTIAAFIVHFVLKRPLLSLILAASPAAILLVWYIITKVLDKYKILVV